MRGQGKAEKETCKQSERDTLRRKGKTKTPTVKLQKLKRKRRKMNGRRGG